MTYYTVYFTRNLSGKHYYTGVNLKNLPTYSRKKSQACMFYNRQWAERVAQMHDMQVEETVS